MNRFFACLILCASLSASAQDDCELFNIPEIAAELQNIQEIAAELQNTTLDTAIVQTDGSVQVQLSNGHAFQLVLGCTDTNYIEYNASANTNDGSCATPVVEGCTDSNYTEYDVEANTDDGSCSTDVVGGCTDPAYLEHNASANTDDGSCATPVVEGCTDSNYTEYDASANTDDGSCATQIVNGCTDADADNYDAEADSDDGSCLYFGCTDAAAVNYDPAANTDDGSCSSCASIEFDGHTYSVVEIGNQCWFAENLQTTVYADDSTIPEVTWNMWGWVSLTTGAQCAYNNYANNVATYGRLYNWYAVANAAGLCPNGWHVPTDGEWTELEDYITAQGFNGTEGTALKSTSLWQWNSNGTDNFGFSGKPGGGRDGSGEVGNHNAGEFDRIGTSGFWWTSSPYGNLSAWCRELHLDPLIDRFYNRKKWGLSVRCLRNAD